ncbi:uncharacterized protein LOC116693558 [Etheostoma spectabile]|uniref:uncharacterized protein LOC116693558 n=1 Tax=Etheostoma spectabile TaxID=54343 RepID=UPI0013AECEDC|nr:uncharacterized protein LOC116693558 [Etheostoma spectabile]
MGTRNPGRKGGIERTPPGEARGPRLEPGPDGGAREQASGGRFATGARSGTARTSDVEPLPPPMGPPPLTEDFFNYYNVPLESLHLPNKSCRAQRVVLDGVPYYMSRTPKDQYLTCGGKPLEKNFTHVFYSMSLLSQVIGNIIRDPVIKMDFTCLDSYLRRVSLTFPALPSSSEMVMRVDELDATIQMTLYTDDSYLDAYSSAPTIELGDKVCVQVYVEPADFFLLRVGGCWATQSPQPNSTEGHVHTLLRHGCVDDKTVSFFKVSAEQSEQ